MILPSLLALLLCVPSQAATTASYDHYMKALLLQRQGLYDEALREFQAVITIDPDSTYVLEQAAQLALDIGQGELAAEFAESLAKRQPSNPKAWHLLGNVRWSKGDIQAARAAYEKALSIDPDYADALYSMGNLLSAAEPAKAETYFLQYLKRNPNAEADVDYQLALLEHRQGRDDSAIERLQSAIKTDSSYLQARYSLAQIYEAKKDTDAALAEYRAILPLDPQNVGLLVRLGEISFERGDRPQAEGMFAKAVALEPPNAAARFWLALLAEQKGDFGGAADQLALSAGLNEDPALNLRLSYYLTQAGRLKEAVAALERARTRWSNDADIAYFLGLGYDDTGQTEKGVDVMRDAVRLKPDSREARFQLGSMLEKLNRMDESEKVFRALLDMKPDDPVALNYLGYSLADRGLKLPESERLIAKAVALDPDNGAYLDSLGWVHHKMGRDDAALKEISQALTKMPTDETVLDHFGDVQSSLGRGSEAWLAWMTSAEYGGAQSKLEPKARKAADPLSSEDLARLYLRLLSKTHDELPGLNSLGPVAVRIGNSATTFTGLLQYDRAEDRLRVDVLNPFWMPIWRLQYSSGTADFGGFTANGISKEDFEKAAGEAFRLVHDWLHGDELASEAPRFKKGWTRNWIETKDWSLFLSKGWPPRLASALPKRDRHLLLELDDYKELSGKLVPLRLRVRFPSGSIEVQLKKASIPSKP